jgi:phosphoribosyl 1,2-cyclic phosphodiesterase
MKTFALATGSSGNCIYVESKTQKVIVDCGLSFAKSKEILDEKGINISDLTGIFITHEHSDHIAGLKQFMKQLNCPVYISEGTLSMLEDIDKSKCVIVKNHDFIGFDDLRVLVVNKPHDAKEAISFIFESEQRKLGIFTDLGHVPDELIHSMKTLNLIYLECNYSQEFVREYCSHMSPKYLNRLMSNVGHLGLHQTIDAIEEFVQSGQVIILSHISENTITYEEASTQVFGKLLELGVDVELEVSFQGEATEMFDLNDIKVIDEEKPLEKFEKIEEIIV